MLRISNGMRKSFSWVVFAQLHDQAPILWRPSPTHGAFETEEAAETCFVPEVVLVRYG